MRAALVIALKDLRILARNPIGLFWVLGFPLLFACLFGSISLIDIGQSTLTVAVVDESGGAGQQGAGQALIAALERHPRLQLIRVGSRDAAWQRVLEGRCHAFLHVPAGFAPSLLPGRPLELGTDPSRPAAGAIVEGRLMEVAMADLLPALRGQLTRTPVHRVRPATSYEVAFPAAMLWAVLGSSSSFAISLAVERGAGTLIRLRMAPVGRIHILAGKALACLLTAHAAIGLLLLLGTQAFGVRVLQPAAFALAATSAAVGFAGLMMLVSTIGRDEQSTAGAGWATLLLMAMIGGGMVPLVAMPPWMQQVSVVSPVRWAIVALEGAIWRGLPWSEQLRACGVLWATGLTGFALGAWRLRRLD